MPPGNSAAEADILGQAYEYLIECLADATNKKAGEFHMPRSVVRPMVNIIDPRDGESIHDPTCGTGGMLLEAIHLVRETSGEHQPSLPDGEQQPRKQTGSVRAASRGNPQQSDADDTPGEQDARERQEVSFAHEKKRSCEEHR